MEGTEAASSRI